MRRTWLFALAALLAACSSDPGSADGEAASGSASARLCAEGFAPVEGDATLGCGPILPPDACPAGTRAAIGSTECVAVGATECAPGFAKDATGWGCDAVIAPAACSGATRERLGSRTCEPLSDCNGPFPPAGATLFVNAAYTDGQLDATHLRTIAGAVDVAKSGALIAVESGTYEEHLVLADNGIRIVGRCADKVVIRQKAGANGSAVEVGRHTGVVLQDLSFRGYNGAVSVLGGGAKLRSLLIEDGTVAGVVAANAGAEVSLENVVVRRMRATASGQAFGVFASAGAKVEIADSVFAGNEFVNVGATRPNTTVRLSRSIVRDGKPLERAFGIGVYIAEGASVVVEESAIVDNSASGVSVFSQGTARSSGSIKRSVVRRTKHDPVNDVGRGVEVTSGKLTVEQSTIGESAQIELIVSTGATAELADVTLLGASTPTRVKDRGALGLVVDDSKVKTRGLAIVSPRAGVELQGKGVLEMESSLVFGTRAAPLVYEHGHWIGLGILVESKATLSLTGSTIQDARVAALLVTGKATLLDTLVRGTRPALDGVGGRGLSLQNGAVGDVSRSAFVDNAETGVVAMLGGTSLTMRESSIVGTALDADGAFGIGLLLGGDALASVEETTISGSKGIGLACAAAGATVRQATISRNTVGVHVQDGTSLAEGDGEAAASALLISSDTRFVGNSTRTGSGPVALPPPIEVPRADR
ncbi:MAG: right-handed parallel beta-helix repeat-containing protein [Labilithrix sp.]|nr:right-handed parallel beta-helix repeat-containing protein [Labilithrix sp.]MBX3223428.1 right-handed parallel beta-helix repeat-containing protein [Labilithrix sp.]